MYKIPPQKTKCNWCVVCAVINDYFTSALYLGKVKKCFQTAELHVVHNRICTKVHFELTKVVQSEKQKTDSLIASTAGPMSTEMPDHERAILRHVCGATIHKVTKDLPASASTD